MANTLRFKRGLVSGIPTAALGEPLFTTDTFDLYIGNGTGNTRFQKYIASGTTSQLLRGDGSLLTMPIVLTSPSNGQVLKYNGTSWVNDSDAGITGSGASTQIAYFTGATTLASSNNFFWDNTNNRLNINTAGSNGSFTVNVRSSVAAILSLKGGASTNQGGALYITNANNSSTLAAFGDSATIAGGTPDLGAMIYSGATIPLQFYVNNAERMRLHANGNLVLGGTVSTDNGLRFQVTGDGFFSGSVGIGSTSLTNRALSIIKTMTGSTDGYGILQFNTVSSGVTANAINNYSQFATQATAFTLTNAYHYYHADISVGAGSTITNQYGYFVPAIQTATNNYGFYGNIVAGTGRWNLYMNGTANNYMAGSLGIGNTSLTGVSLAVTKNITGVSSPFGIMNNGTIQSDATGTVEMYNSTANTQAASFTITNLWHYRATQGSIGAGSSITTQVGFLASAMSTGVFVIGFRGQIASGANRYNLYMDGTADNYLAGNLGVGLTAPRVRVHALLNGNASNGFTGSTIIGQNSSSGNSSYLTLVGAFDADAGIVFTDESIGYRGRIVYSNNNEFMSFWTDLSERMRIHATGNLSLNSTTDAGFRLDVNGTMRVSGASTFGGLMTIGGSATTLLQITSTGSAAYIGMGDSSGSLTYIGSDDGTFLVQTPGSSYSTKFSINSAGAATFSSSVTVNGNMTNAFASLVGGSTVIGGITGVSNGFRIDVDTSNQYQYSFRSGTNTTLFQIANTGAATFSSSVTAASFIPTSSTIPTNGMYLPAANTVGFSTNSTEDMRLTSGGNLLINTTTDSGERLQVNGTAKMGTHSTTGFSLVVQNNGANDASGIRVSTGATVDGYISMAYDATNTYGSIQAGDNNVFRNIIINRQGGSVGIGANPNNSAVLQADSTTRGFLPPRMTTTQRNAIPTPAAGLIVYDTTDNKHYGYNGTTWNAFY